MTEREAFIEAIAAEPNDGTVRLAFADWLQEHGEEDRAEFVRLSCALAAGSQQVEDLNQAPAKLQRIRKRILSLLETCGPAWFDPFCHALGKEPVFARRGRWTSRLWERVTGRPRWANQLPLNDPVHRLLFNWGTIHLGEPTYGETSSIELRHGFVHHASIHLSAGSPVRDVPGAFRREPVNGLSVQITDLFDQWPRLSAPCLARVRQLAVVVPGECEARASEAFDEGVRNECWSGVRDFRLCRPLFGHRSTPCEYTGGLVRARFLSGLQSLNISAPQPDLFPLTSSAQLAGLSQFGAFCCMLPASLGEWLRTATFRPNLETLHLSLNRIGDDGARALASVSWPKLRELALSANELSDAGVQHLLPLVHQLTQLSLDSGTITDVGATALADAINSEHLQSLCLSYNPLSANTVNALRAKLGNRFLFTHP